MEYNRIMICHIAALPPKHSLSLTKRNLSFCFIRC